MTTYHIARAIDNKAADIDLFAFEVKQIIKKYSLTPVQFALAMELAFSAVDENRTIKETIDDYVSTHEMNVKVDSMVKNIERIVQNYKDMEEDK